MKSKPFPFTQNYLHRRLNYDEITGIFKWKFNPSAVGSWNAKWAGKIAGSLSASTNYIVILIDGKPYKAHRLAWFYVHGEQPPEVDHKDKVRNHNWLSNLRPANHSKNQCNRSIYNSNVSGYKGVSLYRNKWWRANININGSRIFLGTYDTPEEASEVYIHAAKKYHGEFARWGDTDAETTAKRRYFRPMGSPFKRNQAAPDE